MSAPRSCSVVFTRVEACELISGKPYSVAYIIFLNIHVISVEKNADVLASDFINIFKRFFGSVDKAGFKAVYGFNTVCYAAVLRRFNDFLHALNAVFPIRALVTVEIIRRSPACIAHARKQRSAHESDALNNSL